ncbi:hypothetical protein HaLaN_21051 [Haematococcus lacustris]|uniref:Uncharacterized protein n=1 Tax=Haematococcus lacustris TaxID=44745 RepID=A0A699ZUZ6_HAELA|nr:hypothetical protein HaLaN_21051 [Haematococcus lacustris]
MASTSQCTGVGVPRPVPGEPDINVVNRDNPRSATEGLHCAAALMDKQVETVLRHRHYGVLQY